MSERRWGAVAAIVAVVLWIVGFNLAGSQPHFNASAAAVVSYFQSNHKAVLIGSVLVAIGILFYLAAMAQLQLALRGAGQRSLAALVGLCAAATAGLLAVGTIIYGALGQATQVAGIDPGIAQVGYQIDQFAGMAVYWLVIGIVFSVTAATIRGVFLRPMLILNSLIMVLLVLGGISVKASGVFAAGTGLFAEAAFIAALVFLVEVGILLWRTKEPAPAPVAQPAQTTA